MFTEKTSIKEKLKMRQMVNPNFKLIGEFNVSM
jgi:hypothetical protein